MSLGPKTSDPYCPSCELPRVRDMSFEQLRAFKPKCIAAWGEKWKRLVPVIGRVPDSVNPFDFMGDSFRLILHKAGIEDDFAACESVALRPPCQPLVRQNGPRSSRAWGCTLANAILSILLGRALSRGRAVVVSAWLWAIQLLRHRKMPRVCLSGPGSCFGNPDVQRIPVDKGFGGRTGERAAIESASPRVEWPWSGISFACSGIG